MEIPPVVVVVTVRRRPVVVPRRRWRDVVDWGRWAVVARRMVRMAVVGLRTRQWCGKCQECSDQLCLHRSSPIWNALFRCFKSLIAGVLFEPIINLRCCESLLPSSLAFKPGQRCHNPFPRRTASTRIVCVAAESLRYKRKGSKLFTPAERQALFCAAPNFLTDVTNPRDGSGF